MAMLSLCYRPMTLSDYRWISFTRNDVFWLYPHPPTQLLDHPRWLEPGTGLSEINIFDIRPVDLWVPACFDYGGIMDRAHTVRLKPPRQHKPDKFAIREQIRKAKKLFLRFTRAVYARKSSMPSFYLPMPAPNATDPSDTSWRFFKGWEGPEHLELRQMHINGELTFRRFLDHHDFKIGRFDCVCMLVKTGQIASDVARNVLSVIGAVNGGKVPLSGGASNPQLQTTSPEAVQTVPSPQTTCPELETPGFSEVFGVVPVSFRNHQLFNVLVQANPEFRPNAAAR